MKIWSLKSWRKLTTSQSTQQNYFSSAKPGDEGPAASVEELNEILQKHSEIADKVVWTELSYYGDTHKTEISYQPHLLKVSQNGQKVQEMNLPSNEETLTILREKDNPIEMQHTEIEVNQICVTLWIEKNKHTWDIGHFTEITMMVHIK